MTMTESELIRLLFDRDNEIHKTVMEWLESSRIAMLERLSHELCPPNPD